MNGVGLVGHGRGKGVDMGPAYGIVGVGQQGGCLSLTIVKQESLAFQQYSVVLWIATYASSPITSRSRSFGAMVWPLHLKEGICRVLRVRNSSVCSDIVQLYTPQM